MALLKSTGNKKVNLDFNKEFINTFSDKIENGNIEFINQAGESVYNELEKESDQIVQIQNILARTLITWLGVISLLAITGIFI